MLDVLSMGRRVIDLYFRLGQDFKSTEMNHLSDLYSVTLKESITTCIVVVILEAAHRGYVYTLLDVEALG